MSFQSLKETLKPCKTLSSSASAPTSPISSKPSLFQGSEVNFLRKPPKSSLSLQLLRLQDSFPPPQDRTQCRNQQTQVGVEKGEKEEKGVEGPEPDVLKRCQLGQFQFDHAGPFEPLILSSKDETPLVQVPSSINCRLLEHQREGVKFLYGLYKNGHGGILGDDMGLGKTIQTIAFLAAVYGIDGDGIHKEICGKKKGPVLIVCPTSVIHNWENEFSKWANFSVAVYHGANRELIHDKLEAGIKTLKRFGLTGTIMQNKIMELFNLFDLVAPGSLGTREHFREFYDEPLKHGQRSTAPERFIRIADKRKQYLATILKKYMLRRTKQETIGHLMLGKEDNVLFCAMSELQKRVYRRMLQLPDIQCLINKDLPCGCGSPLTQAECCKRTVPDGIIWPYLHRDNPEGCDSCPFCIVLPCLVKLQQISNHLELIKPNPKDDPDKQRRDAEFASKVFGADVDLVGGSAQNESFMALSDVRHCGKMRALEKLFSSWISQGDKILLFSYSVRMLDILEKLLVRKGYSFSRLDGSTPTNSRQTLVDDFNSSPSKQVFLISTRAGGLGLNLVSANRVVIFDPNWNPAQDLQAQDRSFRFGQKRHVVVFRLLAAGSLEELVYSRQVYKQQLSNIVVSGKMEKRYFEGVQDCKEFQGELFGICNLFSDLSDKLFTSEIIEMHEGRETKEGHAPNPNQNISKAGSSVIFKETDAVGSIETRKPTHPGKTATIKPTLEDLGVVYAHRNEDIVNYGPGTQEKMALPTTQDCALGQPRVPEIKKRKLDNIGEKDDGFSSTMDWKKVQYRKLAGFKGMGELEFSKWLLCATPLQREKVLEDYKKRKEKIPNG
ncbi:switch 2 isoform X2 [Cucurbita pepo subsp. pepo]|uniref:switch 2 isoform X2 n=1 Tax=Cucurbita pepo subsp. pepo TaxID=3664 RepID=UPI000C9D6DEE|nr:switch 2 isoform X2 [Cucurbita pepo subsp. pepo]